MDLVLGFVGELDALVSVAAKFGCRAHDPTPETKTRLQSQAFSTVKRKLAGRVPGCQ